MSRHPQWEPRLVALVSETITAPHGWGSLDCLIWAGLIAEAVTGEDHYSEHLGKYGSFASAYAYLKRLGFDSPEALLDSKFAEKPVGFAQRGDLVLVRTDTGDNPGGVMGGFAMVVGEQGTNEGLIRAPRPLWLKAWVL